MRLEHGVNFTNAHPRLIEVVTIADEIHRDITSRPLEITSGRRRKKSFAEMLLRGKGGSFRASFHSPGKAVPFRAFDARIWYLRSLEKVHEYKRRILARFSDIGLQVVIEPDDLSPGELMARGGIDKVAPHIHHELDPDDLSVLDWTVV